MKNITERTKAMPETQLIIRAHLLLFFTVSIFFLLFKSPSSRYTDCMTPANLFSERPVKLYANKIAPIPINEMIQHKNNSAIE